MKSSTSRPQIRSWICACGQETGGALRNRSHSTWAVRWITSGGLLDLIQTAAKKIDIAIANKCTVCYLQEVGRFYTDSAALVTVSFETQTYELCYAVVQVMNGGGTLQVEFGVKLSRTPNDEVALVDFRGSNRMEPMLRRQTSSSSCSPGSDKLHECQHASQNEHAGGETDAATMCALYYPPGLSQAAAIVRSSFTDHRPDRKHFQFSTMRIGIVSGIRLHDLRSSKGPTLLAPDRGNPLHQGQQLRHVVAIRLRDTDRKGYSLSLGENRVFCPLFSEIHLGDDDECLARLCHLKCRLALAVVILSETTTVAEVVMKINISLFCAGTHPAMAT